MDKNQLEKPSRSLLKGPSTNCHDKRVRNGVSGGFASDLNGGQAISPRHILVCRNIQDTRYPAKTGQESVSMNDKYKSC
jgi:hypothetical protein